MSDEKPPPVPPAGQPAGVPEKPVGERSLEDKPAEERSIADKSLVVGMDPAAEGFFWLAGQGGYSFQTAPAAARCAAALVAGTGIPDDIADLGITAADLSPARLHEGSKT